MRYCAHIFNESSPFSAAIVTCFHQCPSLETSLYVLPQCFSVADCSNRKLKVVNILTGKKICRRVRKVRHWPQKQHYSYVEATWEESWKHFQWSVNQAYFINPTPHNTRDVSSQNHLSPVTKKIKKKINNIIENQYKRLSFLYCNVQLRLITAVFEWARTEYPLFSVSENTAVYGYFNHFFWVSDSLNYLQKQVNWNERFSHFNERAWKSHFPGGKPITTADSWHLFSDRH